MIAFTEFVIEQAALVWLESIDWTVKDGAEIAPGDARPEGDVDHAMRQIIRELSHRRASSSPLPGHR